MTRSYAAYQLLRHGPLTLCEIVEITGWPYRRCVAALSELRANGKIRNIRTSPSTYEVMA